MKEFIKVKNVGSISYEGGGSRLYNMALSKSQLETFRSTGNYFGNISLQIGGKLVLKLAKIGKIENGMYFAKAMKGAD